MIMVSFGPISLVSLVLLAGSLINQLAHAGKIIILDEAGQSADIETIAATVCEKLTGTGKQIAHISTIPRLVEYLQAAGPDHRHHHCSQLYLDSLRDLAEVLESANESVCGDRKLNLIEEFHRRYVSKVRKHVEQQRGSKKVPKVARLFFMQYAAEISTRCEQAALEALAQREHEIDEDVMASMNKVRAFTDALGMSDLLRGYRGIYLLWNMIDNLPLEADEKFSLFLEKRGSGFRMNVQLNDPRSFALVQAMCSLKMKPIYSQSVLPVLRLSDLGYYPQSESKLYSKIQDTTSAAHNLFVATQICETILPLRVYQDKELKPDQIVALTREEAGQLEPLEVPEEVLREIEKVSAGPFEKVSALNLDRLPAVSVGEARERVETIKSAVESRSNIMTRMFRMIMKNMKNKIKSSLGKYLLSRKSKRNLLEEATLEKIDSDSHLEATGNSIGRRRRESPVEDAAERTTRLAMLKSIAWNGVLLFAQLVLWTLKITILLVPTMLLLFVDLLTGGYAPLVPVYKRLFELWEVPRVISQEQ